MTKKARTLNSKGKGHIGTQIQSNCTFIVILIIISIFTTSSSPQSQNFRHPLRTGTSEGRDFYNIKTSSTREKNYLIGA
jgi:hypothetical protein